MAQKVVTLFADDLTGEVSKEVQTHTILVDGAGVSIDLTPENYDELLELLSTYLEAKGARRVRVRRGSIVQGRTNPKPDVLDSAQLRVWAKKNGFEVSDRGRVPAHVREAYEKTN